MNAVGIMGFADLAGGMNGAAEARQMGKLLLNLFQPGVSLGVSDMLDRLVVLCTAILEVQFQYLCDFRSQAFDLSFKDA